MVAAYTGELSSFQAFCARCGRGSPEVTALYRDLLRAFQRASPGYYARALGPSATPISPRSPAKCPCSLATNRRLGGRWSDVARADQHTAAAALRPASHGTSHEVRAVRRPVPHS